jgi:hypothetical protein
VTSQLQHQPPRSTAADPCAEQGRGPCLDPTSIARLGGHRAFCADALQTLRAIAAAGSGAEPATLVEAAGRQADAVRVRLAIAGDCPMVDELIAFDPELEELRCHLHDTTLQVLEYLACGGYGLCTDAATIRLVADRAASDLATWLELPPAADPMSRLDVGDLVRALVADAERLGLPRANVLVDEDVPLVDERAARALRGAVRESLTNVRKHARAHAVSVMARLVEDEVVVLVSDDGVGFGDAAVPGIGLPRSIAGRLATAGGAAQVVTSDRGTHVQLRVRCTA